MNQSTIQPFSASINVSSVFSHISHASDLYVPTSSTQTLVPFSEGIVMPKAPAKEPSDVKRAFTNLRKAWMEDRAILSKGKKPPTAGEVRKAEEVLSKWKNFLINEKKLDLKTSRRIQAALKCADEYKPPAGKPSAAKLAKAEKVIRVIAKESGRKLAARIVARFALKIVPFLGTALMIKEVADLARSAPAQKFFRKVTGREGSFSELEVPDLRRNFYPRIPAGEYYHPAVGWY